MNFYIENKNTKYVDVFIYRLQPVELLGVFRVPKNEEQFNNKPPAMRVRVECYTKKITFPCTIELFRLYCRKER